jgi:hypothetical protein
MGFIHAALPSGERLFSVVVAMAQMNPSGSRAIAVTIWFLFLPLAANAF